GVLQHAVNAVLDGDFGVPRFDVNVTGAALECGEDNRLDQAHHRAGGAIARQTVAGNGLFAFFFLLGSLKSEGLGGLLEDALGLFSALQNVADLPGGGDANQKLLAEQERQLIAHLHLAGIGRGDGQNVVLELKRNEVVAEHQVRGNGTKEFRVDALLPEINESKAVSFGELARELAFVLFVAVAGRTGGRRKLFSGSHDSLLCRPHQSERENRKIQGNQNKHD